MDGVKLSKSKKYDTIGKINFAGSVHEKDIKKADKLMNNFSFFKSVEERHDDAIEIFKSIFAKCLLAKKYAEALYCAEKIMVCSIKVYDHYTYYDYGMRCVEIGEKTNEYDYCIKKTHEIIETLSDDHKYFSKLVEIWEYTARIEILRNNNDDAIDAYLKASEITTYPHTTTKYKFEAVKLLMVDEKYRDCLNILNEMIRLCEKTDSLKYHVKEYILYLWMISLILTNKDPIKNKYDTQEVQNKVENHKSRFDVKRSIEYDLVMACIEALENDNVEIFNKAVMYYDRIKRLDNYMTKMLLIIKNKLSNSDNIVIGDSNGNSNSWSDNDFDIDLR
jgi:tetratricopeptide (TPR) repeat protein